MILKLITCWEGALEEGAGASQMQSGIPHLHSLMSGTRLFAAVGMDFESAFALISNLEIVSVTLLAPPKEPCGTSFPDLCHREYVMHK